MWKSWTMLKVSCRRTCNHGYAIFCPSLSQSVVIRQSQWWSSIFCPKLALALALITLSFVSFTFSNRLRHFRPPAVKSLHPFKFTYTLSIHLLLSFWLYICPYVFLSSFCLTLCIFLTVFLWSPRRCNSLIVKHVRLLSVGVHVTKYINTPKVLLKVWNILLHFFHYGWLNFSLHFYGCMCVPS